MNIHSEIDLKNESRRGICVTKGMNIHSGKTSLIEFTK